MSWQSAKPLGFALCFLGAQAAAAPVPSGQEQGFESGLGDWSAAASGGLAQGTGGNNGAWLQLVCNNEKAVLYNQGDWSGSYAALNELRVWAVNQGPDPINLRLCLDGSGGRIASSTAHLLPGDGQWRPLAWTLSPAGFQLAGGSSVANTLGNVSMLRFVSNGSASSFSGDEVSATWGLDDIQVHASAPSATRTRTISPSPSPSPTATATFSDSPTPSATGTWTATGSPTGSATASPTFSGTPTPSPVFSDTPSPSFSATPSPSPSATATPSATPSSTASPVLSATPSRSPSPGALPLTLAQGGLPSGPGRVRRGETYCVTAAAPLAAMDLKAYSLAAQVAAQARFGAEAACLQTQALAPGIYLLRIDATLADGRVQRRWQKFAILP